MDARGHVDTLPHIVAIMEYLTRHGCVHLCLLWPRSPYSLSIFIFLSSQALFNIEVSRKYVDTWTTWTRLSRYRNNTQ